MAVDFWHMGKAEGFSSCLSVQYTGKLVICGGIEMQNMLELSLMRHTWILDLDGTVVKHNGYKIDGYDSFLDGAENFLRSIPKDDTIIFLSSRSEKYRKQTEEFLIKNNILYSQIIFDMPYGERILINDKKPSGLRTSIAINKERDSSEFIRPIISDWL